MDLYLLTNVRLALAFGWQFPPGALKRHGSKRATLRGIPPGLHPDTPQADRLHHIPPWCEDDSLALRLGVEYRCLPCFDDAGVPRIRCWHDGVDYSTPVSTDGHADLLAALRFAIVSAVIERVASTQAAAAWHLGGVQELPFAAGPTRAAPAHASARPLAQVAHDKDGVPAVHDYGFDVMLIGTVQLCAPAEEAARAALAALMNAPEHVLSVPGVEVSARAQLFLHNDAMLYQVDGRRR